MDAWPSLSYAAWKDTYATLLLWTQIVGKIRLVQTPWVNHSWHVVYYVTARGLSTSPIRHGERVFQIDFDFIDHQLVILTGEGERRTLRLEPRTVADFYQALMAQLAELDLRVAINTTPNEQEEAIPFEKDQKHRSYDADAVRRFFSALLQADRLLKQFRAGFNGKCSPVHFFWGGFDLAVTRFSGRPAPEHPGGVPHLPDRVAREAYSHEVSSCGFWPGNEALPEAAFYAYAYPEPEGFSNVEAGPGAYYHRDLREFILPYDKVRAAPSPDALVLDFLQRTYQAAATLGRWDDVERRPA
ncbi:MAG TPA: DUF5996 family protein [Casimicrobiaceae bacterium]|nr:DUF5996 family protein [Casimicrobiaceae bacterium]